MNKHLEGEWLTADQIAQTRGIHPRTIRRWMRYGARSVGGQVVTLSHQRVSSTYFTTREWLDQFFVALNAPAAL